MLRFFREPVNAITHLSAAVISVIGVALMMIKNTVSSIESLISILVFGVSLILLYTVSGVFHMVKNLRIVKWLQKVDHAMIFIFIAASYTPYCLLALQGVWKVSLMTLVWVIAIAGVVISIFYIQMPRMYKTAIYLFMGWLCVIAIYPLWQSLPSYGVIWLVLGGILYTIGAFIYGFKKPNFTKEFGFHELFHLFVMLGSFCHYWSIMRYMIQ